jgi:hypothetical protein
VSAAGEPHDVIRTPSSVELFTILMEWDGGTYVDQVRAASPKQALRKWARGLKVESIPAMGDRTKVRFVEQLASEQVVPLDGLANAWCASASLRGRPALINIVGTVERRPE